MVKPKGAHKSSGSPDAISLQAKAAPGIEYGGHIGGNYGGNAGRFGSVDYLMEAIHVGVVDHGVDREIAFHSFRGAERRYPPQIV